MPAERQLAELEQQRFPQYVQGLCEAFSPGPEPGIRMLAGTQLKRMLEARDSTAQRGKHERWMRLGEDLRTSAKAAVLHLLADVPVRNIAAQVVGSIAAAELPARSWNELMPALNRVITASESSAEAREAGFKALGYVCEECGDHLQDRSNDVLNLIAGGMAAKQTNARIKLAATEALLNSLEFARANMEREAERNLIMQLVFEAMGSADEDVREKAFMCLVEIAELYYEHLRPFMRVIFQMTGTAIQTPTEVEPVRLQAIQFWSAIAEREALIKEEAAMRQAVAPQTFTDAALSTLMPVMLACLPHAPDSDPDADDWTVSKAAGVCIGHMAVTSGSAIVNHVLGYVTQNIRNEDWRVRDAATVAFGYILEGPDKAQLQPVVLEALPLLLSFRTDASAVVKDTAAWTIGRICLLLPDVINGETLPHLMEFVATTMRDPAAASNACFITHNLAYAARAARDKPTGPLSAYVPQLMTHLFQLGVTTQSEKTLVTSFEAINELIKYSAVDTVPTVRAFFPTLIQHLQAAVQAPADGLNAQLQTAYLGALQSVLQRLDGPEDAPSVAHASNSIMGLCLQVLSQPASPAHDDAFRAIGSVANRTEENFKQYMAHLHTPLLAGLQRATEADVCVAAVGCVGDISRAIGRELTPYAGNLMEVMLRNLHNADVERGVKPHLISCIGDVAMAIEESFRAYMGYVMPMLASAGQSRFEEQSFDNVEYLNELREAIFAAYTGIVHGVTPADNGQSIQQHLAGIVSIFDILAPDQLLESDVLASAAGLAGDLAKCVQGARTALAQSRGVRVVVERAVQDEGARENGEWAMGLLRGG